MIRSLSPYYISIPWVSPASGIRCTQYTLSVYIYDDVKATVPALPEYEMTKFNATLSTGTDTTVDIARLVNDFVELNPLSNTGTGYNSTNASWWVKWEYTYIVVGGAVEDTPQGATTKLFGGGYTYGFEGRNIETITQQKLFQGLEFKADRTSFYSLPVLVSETVTTLLSVISYPDNQLNYVPAPILLTTDSGELTKNIWIDLSDTTTDEYIVVKLNNVIIATILIEDELKYSPIDIYFQNKLGFQQSFTFFKERKDNMSVTSDEFENDNRQPIDSFHQFKTFNVQARSSFKCWTGLIDEDNNETIKQLLLSPKIWLYSGAIFTPINIKTKSQEWKTQLNDSLINYEIEFDFSYNEINNI
jgi:hypothetical protein